MSVLPTALGCLGMVVLHLGIGLQKRAVAAMAGGPPGSAARRRGLTLWLGATAVLGAGAAANFAALWLGLAASTLAVFTGVGLLALVLFAQRHLDEPLGRAERGPLGLVLLGTVLGGLPAPAAAAGSLPGPGALLALGATGGLAVAVGLAAERVRGMPRRELVQGVVAGVSGGLCINLQKELTLAGAGPGALGPLALLAVSGTAAFLFLNLAFRRERAVLLVPLGAGCSVLVGVGMGALVQGEPVGLARAAGALATLVGIVLMARAGLAAPAPLEVEREGAAEPGPGLVPTDSSPP